LQQDFDAVVAKLDQVSATCALMNGWVLIVLMNVCSSNPPTSPLPLFDPANQNAPKEIDYFSLDVEGYEFEILKDFDFSTHIFRTLSIEHNFLKTRKEIFDLLTANGYYRVHEDVSKFDDFYVHRTIC
jgi:hypothetical protein